jgi:hypothetical protein
MLSGMIAVIFMAGGLTALTIGGAQADPAYPGVVNTTCRAKADNNPRVGQPARVDFRVSTDGNGGAKGAVSFTYKRVRTGTTQGQYMRSYTGPGWERYAFDGLPRGEYVVRVHFNSQPRTSVYQNCSDRFRQTVRPRR